MSANCIFCRIAAGEGEASVVLDEARVLAFMDVRAFHPGHTLIVPKEHITDITELNDGETARALMTAISRVARAVRTAFKADGISVWQSNGVAAGQEVFHLHFHVIPRYRGDRLLRVYPSRVQHTHREELDEHASLICTSLDRLR
jgi:histidine triad (HIT) family protein